MDEDDAEIDACKVEHLVSAETRSRLTHFLSFLYSDEPAAQAFLEALRTHTIEQGAAIHAAEVFAGAPTAGVRDRA